MSEMTKMETRIKGLSTKEVWGRFWYSQNRVDELVGKAQESAQRWADACWGELIERGEARFKMFNQGEEMR